MAALTRPRNTPRLGPAIEPHDAPIAANTKLWLGSLVCLDAAGRVVPGAVATTLKAGGRCVKTYDNVGGAAEAFKVAFESGTFKWKNSTAGDAIARADVGSPCYIVDDQTVAKTDGTGARSLAGTIMDIESDGVWVFTSLKPRGLTGATGATGPAGPPG